MSDNTMDGGPYPGDDPRPVWDLERYKTQPGQMIDPPRRLEDKRLVTGEYTSDGLDLFWKAFWGVFLSVFTAGIYRFWMTTKLRRHYWGGIQVLGDPLEYTGRGLEKLLGFLFAMVILAVYLGFVNLGLTFVGFSLASDDENVAQLAVNLSILSTLPLIFFAQYRGMRYMMSRTRWRGIRFGMGPGSWGYTFRAILLSALTLVTLGLAYPFQHYTLAKYMTDRCWFGDQRFEQRGSWWELMAAWIWVYVMLFFMGLSIWAISGTAGKGDTFGIIIGVVIYLGSFIALYVVSLRYRYHAFKALWSGKRLGDVSFESQLGIGDAVSVLISAWFITSLSFSLVIGVFGTLFTVAFAYFGLDTEAFGAGLDFANEEDIFGMLADLLTSPIVLSGIFTTYLLAIMVVFAVSQVFFTHRILRRKVDTMVIHNSRALKESRQRSHDKAAEAGGFADALGVDVGAGF